VDDVQRVGVRVDAALATGLRVSDGAAAAVLRDGLYTERWRTFAGRRWSRGAGAAEGPIWLRMDETPDARVGMLRIMGIEVEGKLHAIFDTVQVTDRFQKREFVVEMSDNPRYPQLVLFQLTGDRCGNLDGFRVGEDVRIEFSLRGREWKSPKGEVKYFNSLDVWTLDRVGDRGRSDDEPPPPDEPPPGYDDIDDDLPF